jgi:Tol biopolymer transport system component
MRLLRNNIQKGDWNMLCRRFITLILMLSLSFLLTSCFEVKQRITINKDGSGEARLEVAVQQMWAPKVVPKLKSGMPKGWNVVEEKTKDDKQIVVFERKFKDCSELNDDETQYTFSSERKGFLKKSYELEIKQLKSSDIPFPFEISIKMPGSIDETNGTKSASNEVKWSLQGLQRGKELFVKSSAFALPDFALLKEAFNRVFDSLFYKEAIVFSRNNNLWVIDSDGKNEKQLTREGVEEFSASKNGKVVFSNPKILESYSDEGLEILKVEDLNLYLLDINTGSLEKLTNDNRSRHGVISPDGEKIIFEKADWIDPYWGCCGKGTWLFNLKDKSEKELLKVVPVYDEPKANWFDDYYFVWSPDGKKVSFARSFGKEVPLYTYMVEIDKPESVIQIGKGLGDEIIPNDIHAEKLLFGVGKEDYGRDLYVYNMRTGRFYLLQKDAYNGRFSPDGRRIAFTGIKKESEYYSVEGLYVIDGNKSDITKIYSVEEPRNLSWSSDGKKILFQQNGAIWIIGFDGSNLKKIADNASDPVWTSIPRISFISPNSAKIIILVTIALIGIIFLLGMALIVRKAINVVVLKVRAVPRSIICPQCGKENFADASFCINCGQKLR